MRTQTIASLAVLAILTPTALMAQAAPPAKTPAQKPSLSPRIVSRVFVDVDGGYQSHTFSFSDTRQDPWLAETGSWTAAYDVKSGPTFSGTGGVRVWRQLVARVGYSRFSDTNAAAIVGTVPHPFFFNSDRSISGTEAGLKQQEEAIEVGAAWLIPVSNRLDVRVFGGPSFFRLTRDLLEDVNYRDGYPYDTAEFNGVVRKQVKESATGFHVGGDVSYTIAGPLGVGATARFSQATLKLTSPADGASLSIETGGLQVGGGLRLRFGGGPAKVKAGDRNPSKPSPVQAKRPLPPPPSPATPSPGDDSQDPVHAESPARPRSALEVGRVRIRTASPVFILPDPKRTPLAVLPPGTQVKVRDEQGEWLVIDFDDRRLGTRTGYVLRANCEW